MVALVWIHHLSILLSACVHLNGLDPSVTMKVIVKIEIFNRILYANFFLVDPSVTTPGPGTTTSSSVIPSGGIPCPANTNPCLNGAACYLVAGGGFICNCTAGYTGFLCETIGNLAEELILKYRSY